MSLSNELDPSVILLFPIFFRFTLFRGGNVDPTEEAIVLAVQGKNTTSETELLEQNS